MSVALDAMVLIWAMKQGNLRQSELRELQLRARILVELLHEEKRPIIVPTIAVAELLAGIDAQNHDAFVAEVQKHFFCPPFDLRASAKAAVLWQDHRQLPKEQQLPRQVLKSDILVIATALVAGADTFYSHDGKARLIAEKAGLNAQDLPTHHPDMFVEAEIRRELGMPPRIVEEPPPS